jgi:hypothetical protein
MLFYHYFDFLGPRNWPDDFESVFQQELFHPEIFIPEIIILFIMGSLLIYVIKWKVRSEKDNKQVQTLLLWISIWTFIFIMLFVPGFIIAQDFFGRYEILGAGFGIVASFVVFISSIFIVLNLRKIKKDEIQKEQKNIQIKRLFNELVINYNLFMIFMLLLALTSFIMLFVLEEVTPATAYRITSEYDFDEQRLGLPGTNITINLSVEVFEGPATIKVAIIGNDTTGNWTVSPQEVSVRSNEVKTITFTCSIPQNAPEWGTYRHDSHLVVYDDLHPHTASSFHVDCQVTYDINEYNESQSRLESSTSFWRTWGITQISISLKMIELALIFVFTFVAVTAFFEWNKFVARV